MTSCILFSFAMIRVPFSVCNFMCSYWYTGKSGLRQPTPSGVSGQSGASGAMGVSGRREGAGFLGSGLMRIYPRRKANPALISAPENVAEADPEGRLAVKRRGRGQKIRLYGNVGFLQSVHVGHLTQHRHEVLYRLVDRSVQNGSRHHVPGGDLDVDAGNLDVQLPEEPGGEQPGNMRDQWDHVGQLWLFSLFLPPGEPQLLPGQLGVLGCFFLLFTLLFCFFSAFFASFLACFRRRLRPACVSF